MRRLIYFFVLSLPFFANSELISMTVGRSENHVFTSRETHIQHLLAQALKADGKNFQTAAEDSKSFLEQVDRTILEHLIAEEAKNFSAVRVSSEEVEEARKKISSELFKSLSWKKLQASENEWMEIFHRKIQADRFIRFRAQSSVIPVSDVEAKRYFEENRAQFGDVPFEQFKENVKVFLRRSQVESRLKDWYEVLRSKYKARNFLSEI